MTKPIRKQARRVATSNTPSSTQDPLVDTDSEESKQEEDFVFTTSSPETDKENQPPPVLTQRAGDAAEALFLIKQEERHEFHNNSANRFGRQVLDDGTQVWGMTAEQKAANDSVIDEDLNQWQQQQITRKRPQVNPHAKKARVDPPSSQPTITPPRVTTTTTTTPTPPTTALATTVLPSAQKSPPVAEEEEEFDSDDDIAKSMSSNLIDDDCMLFSEEERKTLGTKRGKNSSTYEARKIATEHCFFDIVKEFGGPHVQSLVEMVPAKYCDGRQVDYRFYNIVGGEKTHEKRVIMNKCLVLFGMKAVALSGDRKGQVLELTGFQYYTKILFYSFKAKGVLFRWESDFWKKGEFHGVMIQLWDDIRKVDPLFGTGRNQAHFDEDADEKVRQAIVSGKLDPWNNSYFVF